MTRLLTTGWETGDIAEAGSSIVGANSTLTVVSATPTPRSGGTYCLKLAVTSGSNLPITYKAFPLGALKTDVWVRFAFQAHALSGTNDATICAFYDSAAAAQATVAYNASDNLLRAYRGTTGGTVIGASSAAAVADVWHLVEVRWQATSTSVGIMEVWLNGTRVINFSGDVVFSATIVGVQTVYLGSASTGSGVASSATWFAYDDIAINDTAGSTNTGRPGDGRVVLLSPTGAGSSTQLTRGGTDTGANWSQTSELPPSMTQYVLSATAAQRDLYALGNLPSNVGSISAVEVIALAQNNDAGAGSLGLTVKSGATTNEGTAQALGTSAAYLRQLYETDPNTSTAWTSAAVDALEAGVTVR